MKARNAAQRSGGIESAPAFIQQNIRSLRCAPFPAFINAPGFLLNSLTPLAAICCGICSCQLAKRERGESALPENWDNRKLPKPTAVSAFAMIADSEEFQERCQAERRRLGVGSVSTMVGDGAKWIWNLTQKVFGKTEECLS